MTWIEIARGAAARHGVSLCEFMVLIDVNNRIPLVRHEFARFAVVGNRHLPELRFDASDYLAAIDSCVARGLLRILSAEDVEDISDIGTTSSFPKLSYRCYAEGSVDFTPLGYETWLAVSADFQITQESSSIVDSFRLAGDEMVQVGDQPTLSKFGTCQDLGKHLLSVADRATFLKGDEIESLRLIFEPNGLWDCVGGSATVADRILRCLELLTEKDVPQK